MTVLVAKSARGLTVSRNSKTNATQGLPTLVAPTTPTIRPTWCYVNAISCSHLSILLAIMYDQIGVIEQSYACAMNYTPLSSQHQSQIAELSESSGEVKGFRRAEGRVRVFPTLEVGSSR